MNQPPPNDLFVAAKQSLSQRDFHKCRKYALAVQKSDPQFPGVAQILAVADTLIAAETQVTKAKDPNWNAILQLNHYCYHYSLISDQFKKLYNLLNPDENRFPFANEAAELVYRAYSVLRDTSTKLEFDVELSKENGTFWVVCTICSDKFVYDNKAYDKCQKCRIKPIKPQSKNDLKIIEKSEAKGTIRSSCMQCSKPFLAEDKESITESTSSDDQECWDCIIRNLDVDIDSFSAYFPGGFDEGCEWIKDVLNSTPMGAVNLTGQEILTGGNKSVADHQINEVEGGEDDDTSWISCPACRKTYQYSGVRQKHSVTCKNLECRGKGRPPVIIILCQKEEDKNISDENVKILMGKGVDAAGKDNAGNGNQGTNVADHQINAGVRPKRFLRCQNQEGRGEFRPPKRMISYQKEKDIKVRGETVKILMGKGVNAAGKDNAGQGKGNGNEGTKVIRKIWNPISIRPKNLRGQENLSGENKSGINVEGVGSYAKGCETAAAAADTIWALCPHCFCKFKHVEVHQEGLLKCQNAVCGKEFNVPDAMMSYQKEEDKKGKNQKGK